MALKLLAFTPTKKDGHPSNIIAWMPIVLIECEYRKFLSQFIAWLSHPVVFRACPSFLESNQWMVIVRVNLEFSMFKYYTKCFLFSDLQPLFIHKIKTYEKFAINITKQILCRIFMLFDVFSIFKFLTFDFFFRRYPGKV